MILTVSQLSMHVLEKCRTVLFLFLIRLLLKFLDHKFRK